MNKNYEIKTEDFFNAPKKKLTFKFIAIIMSIISAVVIIAFVLFLLISNLTKKPVVNKPIRVELTAQDELVQELYSYVTYGRDGQNRNRTFINNKVVNLKNLANYDKIFFGTYFLTKDDFYNTGKTKTDYNLPVYAVRFKTMDTAIKNFFGSDVTFTKEGTYNINLSFDINGMNYVELKYDKELDAFTTLLGNSNVAYTEVINDYYSKLVSAYQYKDEIVLKEKIIYPTYTTENNIYNYKIFKDYNHTILLKEVLNETKDNLTTTPISIETYLDEANIITYTFRKGVDNKYHFVESSIEE